LTNEWPRFNYRVRTYHLDVFDTDFNWLLIDETPILTYDVTHPGLTNLVRAGTLVATAPIYAIGDGTKLPLGYDAGALVANQSQGLLLLHHNNVPAAQAQAISMVVQPEEMLVPSPVAETPVPTPVEATPVPSPVAETPVPRETGGTPVPLPPRRQIYLPVIGRSGS
jgi:hypothetical protein